MTVTPTAEQFLSEPQPDEPDDDFPCCSTPAITAAVHRADPLESIAASLQTIAASIDTQTGAAKVHTELEEVLEETREERDDWEDKHRVLADLIHEIEVIVKPSTSKLANTVREAIGRWRAPEVPTGEPEAKASAETGGGYKSGPSVPSARVMLGNGSKPVGDEEPGVPAAVQCGACQRYFDNVVALQAHGTRTHGADFDYRDEPTPPPANDADVEEWARYAESLGFEVLDTMNRSQIRTMLGIPHSS